VSLRLPWLGEGLCPTLPSGKTERRTLSVALLIYTRCQHHEETAYYFVDPMRRWYSLP
jgi:hypothetical protein